VKGSLWHLRYPIEGSDETVIVATTRPETMLGDTGVAVHPNDERLKHLIGKMVRLPLVNRLIPIVGDEYADPEKGTGAVKITPAHDFNDFDVGRRHGLGQINVLDEFGKISIQIGDFADAQALNGLDRFEARKRIIEMLDAQGLLEKVEPHTHQVPHGDRSDVVIEPWLTEQWYVNAAELAKPAIAAVERGDTTFVPKNWSKTYFEWMHNIQPWCISRQLWWGHQIPVWYGPDPKTLEATNANNAQALIFVGESESEVLPDIAKAYPGFKVEFVETREEAKRRLDDGCLSKDKTVVLYRDPDVLDTWFSSALWPFSTMGWPEKAPELKRHYPTDVLVTGFDLIFFWVARMMMMGLHFMGEVPFHTVYMHALVRDEKGQKMSKSKGNVIDPLEIIDEFGADALRFTLAAMAAQGRDIKLSKQRVEGYRNFGTKLWNAARFAELNGVRHDASFDPLAARLSVNRWIVGEVVRTESRVRQCLEDYKFNDAAAALYHFVWNVFCDWYLELVKPVLAGSDEAGRDETRATTAWLIDQALLLLHPFMPFLTEELWQQTGQRKEWLMVSKWPRYVELGDNSADLELEWVIQFVSEVRSIRAEMNVPAAAKIGCVVVSANSETRRRAAAWEAEIIRLARLSTISFEEVVPRAAAQIVLGESIVALPLEGVIDIGTEKLRLARELEKIGKDLAALDGRLNNQGFVAKAPAEVLEESRERRLELEARRSKLGEALARLD
jgi:valyl-tRNA synthetase